MTFTNICHFSNLMEMAYNLCRLIAGTDHGGLAFRLAEAGYDVWLGKVKIFFKP